MGVKIGLGGHMYVRGRDVRDWFDAYCNHISEVYHVPVYDDYESTGGAIEYNEYGKPESVNLHAGLVHSLRSVLSVDINEFAELMWAAKHEERHLWQYEQYKDPNVTDPVIQHMCEHFVIGRRIDEFYYAAYSKDPSEMDADAWSIRQTCDYFHENYPEYDIDSALVSYFAAKPDYSKYSKQDFLNGAEMVDTFDRLKRETELSAVGGMFEIELAEGPSFRMKKLRTNQVLCNKIDSCRLLRDQKILLGGFLRKEDPAYYMQYPTLDARGYSFTPSRTISKGFLDAVKNGGDGRVSSFYGYNGFENYQKE